MCCIRVYHDNALLRPIQICTVWTLYIHLYSFYFFLYGFLKTQPGAVSTACAPFVATSKTAVIANCPDFKQMHNIRTTIKLGPSSQSHRDQEWARRQSCCRWTGWPESIKIFKRNNKISEIIIRPKYCHLQVLINIHHHFYCVTVRKMKQRLKEKQKKENKQWVWIICIPLA